MEIATWNDLTAAEQRKVRLDYEDGKQQDNFHAQCGRSKPAFKQLDRLNKALRACSPFARYLIFHEGAVPAASDTGTDTRNTFDPELLRRVASAVETAGQGIRSRTPDTGIEHACLALTEIWTARGGNIALGIKPHHDTGEGANPFVCFVASGLQELEAQMFPTKAAAIVRAHYQLGQSKKLRDKSLSY